MERQKFKILLVDDSANVLKSLRRTFQPEGYNILTAESAQAAMVILEDQMVDMIITDENMPGLSGSDFLSMVRKRFPEIIRIMITGMTDIEVAKNAINRGEIYRFFNKPWDDFELLLSVRQAFKQRMIEKENDRLKSIIDEQKKIIQSLEKEFPGITEKKMASDGSIIIES